MPMREARRMAEEHPNVALVRRYYEALEARDLDTVASLVSPEVEVFQTDELPWGGRFHGHDGMTEFFLKLLGTISSQVTIERIYAAGDDVVQIGRTAGTVNATGAEFDVAEVHTLTVQDGLITRFEARIDTPAMLDALNH
jgi:ketosteroid isomerase-like protein